MLQTQTPTAQQNITTASEKSFVCEICGKGFRFRSNLAEHRSVHTAVKPFVCKFCGKSSRLKGNLTKHILKHHRNEQKELLGSDESALKKGKKSAKDPAAMDFLEKSMIILPHPPNSSYDPSNCDDFSSHSDGQTPETEQFFLSLGLDGGSIDLKEEKLSPTGSSSTGLDELFRNSTNDQLLNKCNIAMDMESTADEGTANEFNNGNDVHFSETGIDGLSCFNDSKNSVLSPGSTALTIAVCKALLLAQKSKVKGFNTLHANQQQQIKIENESNNSYESVEGVSMDSSGEGENAENWEMLSSSINQMQERLASDFPENLTLGTASKLDDYGDDNGLVNGLSHQEKPPVRNGGGPVRTQCPKCGKHMRKARDLTTHLLSVHKISPSQQRQTPSPSTPSTAVASHANKHQENNNTELIASFAKSLVSSIRNQQFNCLNAHSTTDNINTTPNGANFNNELRQIKVLLNELKVHGSGHKLEQLMVNLDSRVGRLEKQLEMALNSIYTLVQLQTGINNTLKNVLAKS